MTLVKICGVTGADDALTAQRHGADFIGVLVEVSVSPRSVSLVQARSIAAAGVPLVALTYDARLGLNQAIADRIEPHALQLCGTESPEEVAELVAAIGMPVWKSVHLSADEPERAAPEDILRDIEAYRRAGAAAIVLDSMVGGGAGALGGTGMTHDWATAARVVARSALPVFLAGGLSPANVSDAIRVVRPFGVDASSGVERRPGVKDASRVRSFVDSVRRADSGL